MAQVPCPGCGVLVSPGQGTCAFCQRQKASEVGAKRAKARMLVGALGALAVVVAAGASYTHRLQLEHAFRARQSVVPSAEPSKPRALPPRVEVTESALLLEGIKLFDLPSLSEQAETGVGIAHKAQGPNDLKVVELAAALAKLRADAAREHDFIETTFARETPFRLVVEVFYTAAQSGYGSYHLGVPASASEPALSVVVVAPESTPKGSTLDSTARDTFTAIVGAYGISIRIPQKVGAGCAPGALGSSVGFSGPSDLPRFVDCARSLRAGMQAPPDVAVVAGRSAAPAAKIVGVVGALQCGKAGCSDSKLREPVFENVMFAVPREWSSLHVPPELVSVVRGARLDFRHCYEAALESGSRAGYETELSLAVDARGHRSAEVAKDLPSPFADCLRNVALALPIRTKTAVTLNIPLTFAPTP